MSAEDERGDEQHKAPLSDSGGGESGSTDARKDHESVVEPSIGAVTGDSSKPKDEEANGDFSGTEPKFETVHSIVTLSQETPEGKCRDFADSLLSCVKDGVDGYIKKELTEPLWNTGTARWSVVDNYHANAAAQMLDSADGVAHEEVGRVAYILMLPVGGTPAGIAGDFVPLIELSIDRPLGVASKIIRLVCVVASFALGHPLGAIESLRSLVHDEVVSRATKAFEHWAVSTLPLPGGGPTLTTTQDDLGGPTKRSGIDNADVAERCIGGMVTDPATLVENRLQLDNPSSPVLMPSLDTPKLVDPDNLAKLVDPDNSALHRPGRGRDGRTERG